MGPESPPWSQNGASLPSVEGKLAPSSRTRKEGGGEAILASRRPVWPHFKEEGEGVLDEGILDLMYVDLDFFAVSLSVRLVQANGVVDLVFFAVILDLFRQTGLWT